MKKRCENHPDVAALSFCHGCGRHFCADCLHEGREYYYCPAPDCQRLLENEKLPESIPCPNCHENLLLDENERVLKKFQCPGCKKAIEFQEHDGTGDHPVVIQAEPDLYYAVSLEKMIVLSVATLGLYQLYWFWNNWDTIRSRTGRDIIPIARAIFTGLFCYELFKEVKESAQRQQVEVNYDPGWLTLLYVASSFTWRLPSPYDRLVFVAPLFLLPVQAAINRLAELSPEKAVIDRSYSLLNIVGVALGSILLFLMVVSLFTE